MFLLRIWKSEYKGLMGQEYQVEAGVAAYQKSSGNVTKGLFINGVSFFN